MSVRSCGLSDSSPRKLRGADVEWADVIFVMENKHRTRIRESMSPSLGNTPVYVLDIPDDYQFMDPELIDLLQERVESCLSELEA
ncbi:MAG: hypothetical protein U0936_10395 [Planctomycetaceae bacterium]